VTQHEFASVLAATQAVQLENSDGQYVYTVRIIAIFPKYSRRTESDYGVYLSELREAQRR
jgi:hypothetical protein